MPELEGTIEIDDSFAPNIPQDFEPIGQKTVDASSSASRISTLIQANGMFQTIIANFIGKVADEQYDDLSEESLTARLNPFPGSNGNDNPNLSQIIIELKMIVRSDISNKSLRLRLDLQQDSAWENWQAEFEKALDLFNSMYSRLMTENCNHDLVRKEISQVRKLLKSLSIM